MSRQDSPQDRPERLQCLARDQRRAVDIIKTTKPAAEVRLLGRLRGAPFRSMAPPE